MNIAGMGLVTARGRGIPALEKALEQGWVPPVEVEVKGAPSCRLPVYAVAPETLVDKTVLVKARRADRFTRMAVLAASDALADSGLGATLDRSRLGVIVATALGPHATTFSFLDGILDFGDAAVSPTAFSHSVHNAAASYIAMTLDVRGPTLTLAHFHFAFHQAVLLAQTWLADGRCDAVLVGSVDELGAVLQHVCARMLIPAADGRIRPFAFSPTPESVPGEGSAFFLVTRAGSVGGYGTLLHGGALPAGGSLQVLDACGFAKDETGYRATVRPGVAVAGYAPVFGSLLSCTAFHVAAGALMLKQQKRYPAPVGDNPHGLPLADATDLTPLDHVLCTRMDWGGRVQELHLSRV